jgi:hypothetical protein
LIEWESLEAINAVVSFIKVYIFDYLDESFKNQNPRSSKMESFARESDKAKLAMFILV